MSKRLILVLAFVLVAGLSMAAYAEVQNVKVSGDITIQGVAREKITLRKNNSDSDFQEDINGILSAARVRVDADLTDNVMTTVRLLNERVWGDEKDQTVAVDAVSTNVVLDLAYVRLKEFLYSPLTLSLGRQNLRFGNGLIIGDPDTNGIAAGHNTISKYLPNSVDDLSARKAFDAMLATLNYDPLVVDLVYSKIDENNIDIANDVDLYGINANYAVNKDLNTEGYYFQRTRDVGSTGISTNSKQDITRVFGAKGSFTGIENLMLGLEAAYQLGTHITNTTLYPDDTGRSAQATSKRNAYALQAIANLAIPKVKYTPTIGASYTYLSGDKDGNAKNNYNGWDPMFEDQAGGTLFNKILGYSNAQLINLNTSLKPKDDVKVSLNYYYLRLNNAYSNSASGNAASAILSGVAGDPTYKMKAGKNYLGSEVDLGVTYDYTEDVQFGLNTGAFIPGTAFSSDNKDVAQQVIGSMKVTF